MDNQSTPSSKSSHVVVSQFTPLMNADEKDERIQQLINIIEDLQKVVAAKDRQIQLMEDRIDQYEQHKMMIEQKLVILANDIDLQLNQLEREPIDGSDIQTLQHMKKQIEILGGKKKLRFSVQEQGQEQAELKQSIIHQPNVQEELEMLRELVRLHNNSPITYDRVEKLEKKIKTLQETNKQLLNQIINSYDKPKKELTKVK